MCTPVSTTAEETNNELHTSVILGCDVASKIVVQNET